MEKIRLNLFSTSTVFGSGYLDYCGDAVVELFDGNKEVIFVPYARPGGISHDDYTAVAEKKFATLGLNVRGLHSFDNPVDGIRSAQGIFIGGGNTFLLLKTLYETEVFEEIRNVVLKGVPYMGSSAGSNVAGLTISTTNDMPIVYPPSFQALKLVPFNINPHYLDPVPGLKHMGETRETRIREFHALNSQPVIGVREGGWISCRNGSLKLEGGPDARIFRAGETAEEVASGTDLKFLLS